MIVRIVRDTDYSFIEVSENGAGETLHRKLQTGSTDYKNACSLFHRNNVDIKKGNKIEMEEALKNGHPKFSSTDKKNNKKQIKNSIMIIRTAIVRDTDYSFMEISKKDTGEDLYRKLQNGSTDYKNACSLFHRNNVEIKKGNKIEFEEHIKSVTQNAPSTDKKTDKK